MEADLPAEAMRSSLFGGRRPSGRVASGGGGHDALKFVLRRLAMMPLLLWGIATIAFITSRLVPSDPLIAIVGERQIDNEAVVAAARERWGLDGGLVHQYWIYVKNIVLHFDFGVSFGTRRPVTADIADRLPATLELVLSAMTIATVVGVALGVVAARRQGSAAEHAARAFALVGSSMPVFWSGLLLLSIFYARLGWLPSPGRLDGRSEAPVSRTGFYTLDALLAGDLSLFGEAAMHLLLPSLVLGWALVGIISRLTRSSLIDELTADYIRTARMKGLSERRVVYKHALRNAALPLLTVLGYSFAALLTGAVLTEAIFSWNGVGSYAVEASRTLDYPAINAVCLLGGAAFLVANLVTDVLYAIADPKVRLS